MIKAKLKYAAMLILLGIGSTMAQYPDSVSSNNWMTCTNVEKAGFPSQSLQNLRKSLDSLETAAFMVIYKGSVLYSYGDVTRRFMVHSIRKSMMNAMIGREVEKGTLSLEKSLEELGIDDIGELTTQEKKATVFDLLSSKSGIFHPSAYSPRGMEANLPERGTHPPGKFFFYNNWDFNALLSIYMKTTGKDFFDAFQAEIAIPIGMEDFRKVDTHYRLEDDKSVHPAYLFKMSARDMARFGQLYLNNGIWGGKKIISADWIQKSTTAVTKGSDLGNFEPRGGYGMLWWVGALDGHKVYSAIGTGENRIMVLPEDDMVIVHRSNTYQNQMANHSEVDFLVRKVLKATVGFESHICKELNPFKPNKKVLEASYTGSMIKYLGTYKNRMLGEMKVVPKEGDPKNYVLENNIGKFNLIPLDRHSFYIEDLELHIEFKETEVAEKKLTVNPVFGKNRTISKFIFLL